MVSAKAFRHFGLGLGVLVLGLGIPSARASIIYVNSDLGSDGTDEFNTVNGGPDNSDVAISASPAWAPSGMGYEWVSYAATGCNTFVALTGVCTPGVFNPPASTGPITLPTPSTPTASFFNIFDLPALPEGEIYTGTLDVWADDTARVTLDGITLMDANPAPGGNCAAGAVGCLPSTVGVFNITSELAVGENVLELDAYQFLGASPFGVMYTATITETPADSPTPEPASYVLMGLGLLVIGILIPRARRA
jgi:hypothetical protein